MFDVVNCCWNGFYMNWLTLATAVGMVFYMNWLTLATAVGMVFYMNWLTLATTVGYFLLITTFSPNYFLYLCVGLGKFFEFRIFPQ